MTSRTSKIVFGIPARHLQAIWVNKKPANAPTGAVPSRTSLPGQPDKSSYMSDRATD